MNEKLQEAIVQSKRIEVSTSALIKRLDAIAEGVGAHG